MAMLTCFLFFSVLIITVNKVEADHLVPKNDPTVTEAVEGNGEEGGKVILLHHPINTKSHRIQQDALLEVARCVSVTLHLAPVWHCRA